MQRKKAFIIYCTILSLIFILVSFTVFFFLIPTGNVFAIETTCDNGLAISANPSKELLHTNNMIPGYKVSAPLKVMNTGKKTFFYNISTAEESGDKLFNYLDLAITDKNNIVLYSGKMKNLNGLTLGELDSSKNATFNVTVGLPRDAGDDYQGICTSMKFVLNATNHRSSSECTVWDPPLDKSDVNCRVGDKMPIKFHLENNGNNDKQEHNLELILSGVNTKGVAVQYKYNISDGTLNWNEHGLNQPCYTLSFDTAKCPIAQDTYYTATVIEDDQTLGSTTFRSGK
ncbi:MAG: hypothetical protein P4L69_09440 [Desulfosporosinus sp.]|nr:hypothetical protein [Desulfosporosinus sp.]